MRTIALTTRPLPPATARPSGIAAVGAGTTQDDVRRWDEVALSPPALLGEGARLLQDLRREMPGLSPKLRAVARYCVAHASRLHLQRVQDVAADCGTVPATVVRLAQRFGFHGFQDMKLAFLDLAHRASGTPAPMPAAIHDLPPSGQALSACATQALGDLETSAHALGDLRPVVQTPDFERLVLALRTARCIRFDWAGDTDRTIALHMRARLRALGCHQVGASRPPMGARGEWLVHVAVWDDKKPGHPPIEATLIGTRLLRMTRGHGHPLWPRANDGPSIPCGNDSRRLLTALAFSELLAVLLAPQDADRP